VLGHALVVRGGERTGPGRGGAASPGGTGVKGAGAAGGTGAAAVRGAVVLLCPGGWGQVPFPDRCEIPGP